MLALVDGLQSIRWAYILIQLGDEVDVNEYYDWMLQRFRSCPQKIEQLATYLLSGSWRLCMSMRAGTSFADGTREIMRDWDKFAEQMSKEDTKRVQPKSKPPADSKGYAKNTKSKQSSWRAFPYQTGSKGKGYGNNYRSTWPTRSYQQPEQPSSWSNESWKDSSPSK